MSEPQITISCVRIRRANAQGTNPVAWASFVINGTIRVSNVAVFRDEGGGYHTEFPARLGKHGQRYHYIRPLHWQTRAIIDDAILSALGN